MPVADNKAEVDAEATRGVQAPRGHAVGRRHVVPERNRRRRDGARETARRRAATRQARDRLGRAPHRRGPHAVRRREALLTLRDSQGIKLAKPLTADANGVARFDEALPPNLRYGCSVCVQYPESATTIHADQRDLFVIPTDRTISVTTTVPAEVGPGADVKLGVQLDREEEVDLIVSVFDESLLGVAGDLSKNIRDFYLADARGQGRAARDLAATRVGTVTVAGTRGEGRGRCSRTRPTGERAGTGATTPGADAIGGRRASSTSPMWSRSSGSPASKCISLSRCSGTSTDLDGAADRDARGPAALGAEGQRSEPDTCPSRQRSSATSS